MAATEAVDKVKLFCFAVPNLSGMQLALSMPEVLEVTQLGDVTPVPFAQRSMLGLALWRSEVITIVDLAAAICGGDVPSLLSAEHDLIIAQINVNARLEMIGIPSLPGGGLREVSRFAVQDALPDAFANRSRLFHAIIRSGDHLIGLLNLAAMIASGN